MAKRRYVPHFSEFTTLMEIKVLPHLSAYPKFERLDGHTGKGNRASFATFNHMGLRWKIAMDTKTDRLLAAWKLFKQGEEPFVLADTGFRKCLRLNTGGLEKANGMYVYEVVK